MTSELNSLLDARSILCRALLNSVGCGPVYERVNRAIIYLDKQLKPMLEQITADDTQVSA